MSAVGLLDRAQAESEPYSTGQGRVRTQAGGGPKRWSLLPAQNFQTPVLCVRTDSVYHVLDCDPYDEERDAKTFDGTGPLIAHPPCGSWGRLRMQARSLNAAERELAPWCVNLVRQHGGIVEHPASSTLWQYTACLPPGVVDEFGGHLLPVWQSWWGHKARKHTWLYIVGCAKRDLPEIPFDMSLHPGSGRIESIAKGDRDATPAGMALWLLELARRCG